MLGSTAITAVLGAGTYNTDHTALRSFVREASKLGLAVLYLHPGTKTPTDMRTSQARSKADKAAREEAHAAGRRGWEKVKSPAGLHLATTEATVLTRYLDRYTKTYDQTDPNTGEYTPAPVNLAIEVGRSNLVVVDCDTRAQVERFLADCGAPPDMPPTVITPGKVVDGQWVHRDGGHFYFTVPEGVELPDNLGSYTLPESAEGANDGYAVLWRDRYVVIPPSTREEGAYELVGRDYPLPPKLRDAIIAAGERRAVRAAEKSENVNTELRSAIDAWAALNTWDDLLAPNGWVPTSRPDQCGCPVYTAPGDHSSPKSATAHDIGCARDFDAQGDGSNSPLKIWTDNPPEELAAMLRDGGGTTLTKLQVVAAYEFGGDLGKAVRELGLEPENVTLGGESVDARNLGDGATSTGNLDEPLGFDAPADADPVSERIEEMDNGPADDGGTDEPHGFDPDAEPFTLPAGDIDAAPFPDEDTDDPAVFASAVSGVPRIAPFSYWRDTPPPEYIVEDLIEHRGLSCFIGPPGTGKSAVALDLACHIVTGRKWHGKRTLKTKVLYLPGEGLSGAVQRLLAWEDAHKLDVGSDLMLGDGIIQLAVGREAWVELAKYVAAQHIGLVIFDTYARMSDQVEENSATEVGKAIQRFDQFRQMTGAGVLLVHHTGKASPTVARGSSALNGALDSELLVAPGDWTFEDAMGPRGEDEDWPEGKKIQVSTPKQKNAEMLEEPIPLMLTSWELPGVEKPSMIVTGPSGTVDPMEGTVTLASPVPEPLIDTMARVREYIDRFPAQGVTRSEIARDVRPDAYTLRRADAAKAWKRKVAEAVDKSIRWSLLDTLTGTPSGSRYIPGGISISQARDLAAAEIMTD